jgi:hypothetical protein
MCAVGRSGNFDPAVLRRFCWRGLRSSQPQVVAWIVIVLALVCAMAGMARAGGFSASAVSSSVVVVTNTSDVVNGNVSSIALLNAKPGRDGISLREALEAANHTRGSHTVYIMFSHRLNGKTIEIRSELPPIHRNHLVLEGVAPNGSAARVTIDGRHATPCPYTQLLVQASDVTVRWLRFTGVNPTGFAAAMIVRPGNERNPGSGSPGPKTLTNIRIEDDVFDNSGFNFPPEGGPSGLVVAAWISGPVNTNMQVNANTHINDVTIARNTFLNYTGSDAVLVAADGSGATVDGVVIEDNSFAADEYSVELATAGTGPRQTGTQIIGNTITGGTTVPQALGISVNETNSADALIDGTLIEDNSLPGFQESAINLRAAGEVSGYGGVTPSADVISNTQMVNNVISADSGGDTGIYLDGGDVTTSPVSRISGVTIESNTLVNDGTGGSLLELIPNGIGATGNQITGVTVRNTILWAPNGTPISEGSQPVYNQPPDAVANSLISGPGWAGSNGNIDANPDFVNEPGGDYQLVAGSRAINAGTTVGAPTYDILGAPRRSPPDIGAFEYGALPRPLLAVMLEQLGGSGTVTSSPPGIGCGTTCSAQFDPSTTVTLTAKPDPRSRFLGWTGACSGKHRCTIVLSRATPVTARFGLQ